MAQLNRHVGLQGDIDTFHVDWWCLHAQIGHCCIQWKGAWLQNKQGSHRINISHEDDIVVQSVLNLFLLQMPKQTIQKEHFAEA